MSLPVAVLRLFQQQMDRLRSEECLLERVVIASGTGSLKDDVQRDVIAVWRRAINGDQVATPREKKGADQMRSALGMIGIGMTVDNG